MCVHLISICWIFTSSCLLLFSCRVLPFLLYPSFLLLLPCDSLLKKSLPESFFSTDYDGLQLVLLLQRLKSKAQILRKNAVTQFRLNDGIQQIHKRKNGKDEKSQTTQ
mgnify:CR=1 FL=1